MGDQFDFLPGTLKDGKGPLQLLGDGKFGHGRRQVTV